MSTTRKAAAQLEPGDRIVLPTGAVRTVSHFTPTGYVNYRDEPVMVVHYVEPADPSYGAGKWTSTANTTAPDSVFSIR